MLRGTSICRPRLLAETPNRTPATRDVQVVPRVAGEVRLLLLASTEIASRVACTVAVPARFGAGVLGVRVSRYG